MIDIDWQLVGEIMAQEALKWFDALWNGIIWPLVDFVIFIELNNPAGEVALFITLIGIIISVIVGAVKFLPRLIQRFVFQWY